MFFSSGASKWVLAAPLPKVLSCWRRTHTYHTNDLDDKCQWQLICWNTAKMKCERSHYIEHHQQNFIEILSHCCLSCWRTSPKLLSHLLKDLSSTIWLKAATLSIPGTPPVFSGGGKVENTPENIFSFLWRIDVVILNTMFVKSWLHLYSKVLRWNQHTNSWEKVNHLHDRHHHQNRWDAPTEKDMLSLPLTSSPSGATTTPSGPRRSSRKKKKFSN